jgi:hypothetical protein
MFQTTHRVASAAGLLIALGAALAAQAVNPLPGSPGQAGVPSDGVPSDGVSIHGWSIAADPTGVLGSVAPHTAVADPKGGVFVAGARDALRVWIARFDEDGVPRWQRSLRATNSGGPLLGEVSLAASAGGLFLASFYDPTDLETPLLVAKLNKTGDLEWARQIREDFHSFPWYSPWFVDSQPDGSQPHVVATSDGGCLVAFTSAYGFGALFHVVRFDSAGSVVWTKFYSGRNYVGNFTFDVAPSGADGLLALIQPSDGARYVFLCRVDALGEVAWSDAYDPDAPGLNYDLPRAIAATSDGGVVVSGRVRTSPRVWAFSVDATGAIRWSRSWLDASSPDRFDPADAVAAPDGSCTLVGDVLDGDTGRTDLWVTQLGSAGDVRWSRALGGAGDELGFAIDRDLVSGRWLVAGRTEGSFAATGVFLSALSPGGLVNLDPSAGAHLVHSAPNWADAPLTRGTLFSAAVDAFDAFVLVRVPIVEFDAADTRGNFVRLSR